ncbi:hypothetical protein GCM10010191_02610 [Actinomadura vinacea]|uniref:PucR C-terminal helix-turn-helix domain-containing protein n=1 Tax=Actinomadura vinacea TaxID=115336 RepID=A0ABP5VE53_9ACTN
MPTLGELCKEPDFSLRLVVGDHAAKDRVVKAVGVMHHPAHPCKPGDRTDALVVTGLPRRPERLAGNPMVEDLLNDLARQKAAGLALVADRQDGQAIPVWLRSRAARLNVPLLTTTRTIDEWGHLAPRLRAYRAGWYAERLTALLERLPSRSSDPGALQRVAEWLAATVDAEVLVSDPERGILAACPQTAPATLAPLLARHAAAAEMGAHTRVTALAGARPAVLALHSGRPLRSDDDDLVEHAARVLGLIDQAAVRQRELSVAEHGVRLGAFQLLMTGEVVAARRVLSGLAPRLLAAERVRVHLLDCAGADREPTAEQCENALDDRAMMVRCPAFNHLIIVAADDGSHDVRDGLRKIVATLPQHRMGCSRAHPLDTIADAYTEASDALTLARHAPDRVALAQAQTDLVEVLPVDSARRWAAALLHPLLALPVTQRDQLLRTLDLGLDFQHKAAGRILGVHRNTIRHRIDHAFGLLGLDRTRLLHQVVVSAALKIVFSYGHREASADLTADFTAMLSTPRVRSWAQAFLQPLEADRRDLLRTLTAWLDNNAHAETTAGALNISPITVRNHVRAAVPLLQHELVAGLDQQVTPDEHVLGGVRPLAFALYAGTRRPALPATWTSPKAAT